MMGCISTTPVLPNIRINEHGFPINETDDAHQQGIATVSYSPRKSIKRANEINAGMLNIYYRNAERETKNNKNTRYSRQEPKRSRQSGRLTPSRMDFDTISICSIMSNNSSGGNVSPASLDLSAITDKYKHHHWNFPRWGHYKKCTLCGCQSHSPKDNNRKSSTRGGRKGTLRKQNNQKIQKEGDTVSGGCAMAFANLLAMVSRHKTRNMFNL